MSQPRSVGYSVIRFYFRVSLSVRETAITDLDSTSWCDSGSI